METIRLAARTCISKMRWRPIVLAVMLTPGAIGGWVISTMFAANGVGLDGFYIIGKNDTKKLLLDEPTLSLIGSYVVTGTDPDGKAYAGTSIVDISSVPSGALELEWDNGKQVGVGQVIGNVLAVAWSTRGRTAILIMNINPDGSLSGSWSRRADRGYKGTETWKKG
jgi:hypothetical protein